MRNKTINKQIFLDNLPHKGKVIDWINSVGCQIKFVYDDVKGIIKIVNYNSKTHKLKVKYNNEEYEVLTKSITDCKLGNILKKITSEFKIEIGTRFKDNKRDITIIDRKYIKNKEGRMLKYYKYKCNKCGFDCSKHYSKKEKCFKDEYWMLESEILRGSGCSCCSPSKITVKGINDIVTTHPELVKYFVNKEDAYIHTFSSTYKVLCKCPNCKKEKIISIQTLIRNGFNCLICSDGISYPNKFMFNLLDQLELKFKVEYSPCWINDKRYDFYIPSKKLIIEMDGGWHYKNNVLSGQTKEESQAIDCYKDKMAKEHGLKVIRINCDYQNIIKRFEYIKNNVINKLNNIFDLNNVNWEKCNLYSCNSLLLQACKIKKENPNLISEDISKEIGISKNTIIRWLKIGNELGLCYYNSKEEIHKAIRKKNNPIKSKQIEIFKDGNSVGVFPSISEFVRQSKKLFNVDFFINSVSRHCKNNKPYKGYIFKYV